jgi:2-polyprenyl-6-methoxyphenol hydroxylase-like FAD-dependent oxidoreductase
MHRYVRPRFALIGDAAHAVHPLAGQGVNLGLADAACLAGMLHDGVALGRDPGDAVALATEYERPRMAANSTMMAVLHGLQRAFGLSWAPLGGLRSAGLQAINLAPPVRDTFMRAAMGEPVTDILPFLGNKTSHDQAGL